MSHHNNDTQKVGTDLLKSRVWNEKIINPGSQEPLSKKEVPSVITSVTEEEEEKKPAK